VTSLDDLLTVQELDTKVDQLRHRREHLPERAELTAAQRALQQAEAAHEETHGRLRKVRAAQKEEEDHASLLDDKAAAVQASMYDGSVTSPKELESLQAEQRMLKEHQSQHEDRALELMEEAEPIDAELAEHAERIAAVRADVARLEGLITVAEAELDVELDELLAQREQAGSGLPEEIRSAYETLRRQLGGVGAARLVGARCEGCHLEIPSAQLEDVRRAPADALVTCPECLRILVR
jgi:predicted  nucleic acid-binding Zn-ribbon protein